MDRHHSELHSSNWRMGKVLARRGREGLPDRDDDQQQRVRHRRADERAAEARVGVDRPRPRRLPRHEGGPRPAQPAPAPQHLPVVEGAPSADVGAGGRGRGRARGDDRERPAPAPGPGRGPDRHPHDGAALHLPLQRELDHEPDPGHVPRARLLLQPLPRQAAGARGRRAHHEPPHARGSSTRCTTRATSTSSSRCSPRRPTRSRSRRSTRCSFAEDEWYRHLYRTSYAYHGVHPFYMWYWGAHALQHLGRVIIVGGDTRAVRRLGFMPASTLQDALEMASDIVGPQAHDHAHPQPADPDGRRHVSPPSRGMRPTSTSARPRATELAKRIPVNRSTAQVAGKMTVASVRRRLSFPVLAAADAARRRGAARRRARSAATTTPSGPAATRPAWPGCCCSRARCRR